MEIEKFTIQPRTHYGYSLPNMVAADAGRWGTHVEISHRYPNGPKKPSNQFTSKSEQRYAQTEKEL